MEQIFLLLYTSKICRICKEENNLLGMKASNYFKAKI